MATVAKPLWKCFGIAVTNPKRKRSNSMTTTPNIVGVPIKRPSRAQEFAAHKRYMNPKPSDSSEQCHCCLKPISKRSLPTALMIHMNVNGTIVPVDAVLTDSESQGWFFVGTACAKKHYPVGYYKAQPTWTHLHEV